MIQQGRCDSKMTVEMRIPTESDSKGQALPQIDFYQGPIQDLTSMMDELRNSGTGDSGTQPASDSIFQTSAVTTFKTRLNSAANNACIRKDSNWPKENPRQLCYFSN
ncbi:unnamed protein product [Nezara viridula]|uniref:Uncharacterized protein n=1 Tax=Nezara viridula TaxID=85310 RepID=A0A9P0MDR2_NEZVI|nr:unnamed protein product [Nezara viridula]